jgi:hypothetical protein
VNIFLVVITNPPFPVLPMIIIMHELASNDSDLAAQTHHAACLPELSPDTIWHIDNYAGI